MRVLPRENGRTGHAFNKPEFTSRKSSTKSTTLLRKRRHKRLGIAVAVTAAAALLITGALQILGIHPIRAAETKDIPFNQEARFEPTKLNSGIAPSSVPDGMVWIPGGEFSMGANDPPDMDEVGMKA